MIVARVDSTNTQVWSNNQVNCNPSHNYYEMLRAGGSTQGEKTSDPFPGTKNTTMLGNETMPNLKSWSGENNAFEIFDITENDDIITFTVKQAQPAFILKEDFESMPATTNQSASNVQGVFAKWSFTKSYVNKPGAAKAIGEHSVLTKLGARVTTTTPINENISQASMKIFNASTTVIKYRLEYSTDNGATWTVAKTTDNRDAYEVATYSNCMAIWDVNLTSNESTLFRITHLAGNKNCFFDDFALSYSAPQSSVTGDVNSDGEVNVADVNAIINMVLSGSFNPLGDVNGDGEVNIADINKIIDIILSAG